MEVSEVLARLDAITERIYWRGFRDGAALGIAVTVVVAVVSAVISKPAQGQTLDTKVTWHVMPTVEAAREKCAELMGGGKAIACSRWNKERTWCEVWAIDPTAVLNNDYHERVLGHEVLHCFKGNFHEGRPN